MDGEDSLWTVEDDGYTSREDRVPIRLPTGQVAFRLVGEPQYCEELILVFDSAGGEYRPYVYPDEDSPDAVVVAIPTGQDVRDRARVAMAEFVGRTVGFPVTSLSWEELLSAVDATERYTPRSFRRRAAARMRKARARRR
jgi:hypothetical protein